MTSQDQYAAVASSYRETEDIVVRRYAEMPTFLAELGPIEGARVLDLACGTGIYSRLLARAGASQVVGVDASAPMIEQARAETEATLPIRYEAADVTTMGYAEQFDVVNAAFLLNYAAHRDELDAMCRVVAAHIKRGGRFYFTVPNPDYDFYKNPIVIDDQYGATFSLPDEVMKSGQQPWDGLAYTFVLQFGEPVSLSHRYWTKESYRDALEEAGIRWIGFTPWTPSPDGAEKFGEGFWRHWIENPLCVVGKGYVPE